MVINIMIWFASTNSPETGLAGGSVFKCRIDLIYKIHY